MNKDDLPAQTSARDTLMFQRSKPALQLFARPFQFNLLSLTSPDTRSFAFPDSFRGAPFAGGLQWAERHRAGRGAAPGGFGLEGGRALRGARGQRGAGRGALPSALSLPGQRGLGGEWDGMLRPSRGKHRVGVGS